MAGQVAGGSSSVLAASLALPHQRFKVGATGKLARIEALELPLQLGRSRPQPLDALGQVGHFAEALAVLRQVAVRRGGQTARLIGEALQLACRLKCVLQVVLRVEDHLLGLSRMRSRKGEQRGQRHGEAPIPLQAAA
ncbi:hypothetical protein D3C72_860170 [compost metagenome]